MRCAMIERQKTPPEHHALTLRQTVDDKEVNPRLRMHFNAVTTIYRRQNRRGTDGTPNRGREWDVHRKVVGCTGGLEACEVPPLEAFVARTGQFCRLVTLEG